MILMVSTNAWAGAVTFSAVPVGGGLFQYSLTIINTGEPNQPIAGLNILNGNSVFGLTPSSIIMAPPNWSFFSPDPGIGANELNYFSLSPLTDVSVGGSLGGFTFLSMTNPGTISGSQFAFDLVPQSGPNCCTGTVRPVPEPTTILLLGTSLTAVVAGVRGRRKSGKSKVT
jgi:hypothetical protein